ncbi:hypothetical protein [Hymenobacter sp. PAMC 26628]|uniref:hypothetical protein n=1 Tax=Hymenobacter sp. PAMC 26628 TaxID=1484118 RepID=UPI0007705B84|nr:hypothetical protein [Hymenobacter sp. PAMC 26628]AMJ67042.1 hypothetical protein AXW84_17600 [Hymenobacter sp. PAMC 26628]
MTKEQVITSLQNLPDDFQLEDLFERLLFVQHLDERVALSQQPGNSVSFEEAQRLINDASHAA